MEGQRQTECSGYRAILFSHRKEENSAISDNVVGLEGSKRSEINPTHRDKDCMVKHMWSPKKKKGQMVEAVKKWLPGARGWGDQGEVDQTVQAASWQTHKG